MVLFEFLETSSINQYKSIRSTFFEPITYLVSFESDVSQFLSYQDRQMLYYFVSVSQLEVTIPSELELKINYFQNKRFVLRFFAMYFPCETSLRPYAPRRQGSGCIHLYPPYLSREKDRRDTPRHIERVNHPRARLTYSGVHNTHGWSVHA